MHKLDRIALVWQTRPDNNLYGCFEPTSIENPAARNGSPSLAKDARITLSWVGTWKNHAPLTENGYSSIGTEYVDSALRNEHSLLLLILIGLL
jgi:hypothetical protein